MKILVIGFKNSGTSILRQMLEAHPHVAGSYIDKNILVKTGDVDKYTTKRFESHETFVESISFYDQIGKIDVVEYCRRWIKQYGDDARIIHIVRHPVDVALSIADNKKTWNIKKPLERYKQSMRFIIQKINNLENTMTIKYEDFLLKPDEYVPKVFDFCSIDKDVDFRALLLSRNNNSSINILNTSGVFRHEYKTNFKYHVDMNSVFTIINSTVVDGEEYK